LTTHAPAEPGRPRLQVGGTLNPRRHLYIERPEDATLVELLLEGQYANVLTSRQMGKSSLMVRTAEALIQRGVRCAIVDLAAELGTPEDPTTYFIGLLNKITRDLRIQLDLRAWWSGRTDETVNQRLMRFFCEVVLEQVCEPVVVFLDEIDSTLKLPWTDDLFTALRGMHNERPLVPAYERLTFCLIGVAAPNELIKVRRTTPYNVGCPLELRDFNVERDDLTPLTDVLGPDRARGWALVERVLHWTGGHPYLTIRLCALLVESGAETPEDIDRCVDDTFRSLERVSGDVHFQQVLRFLETRLADGLATFNLYEKILRGARERDQPTLAYTELKLSGLAKRNEEGLLVVRNRIYTRLFDQRWVESTKPKRALQRYRRLAIAASLAVFIIGLTALMPPRIGFSLEEEHQTEPAAWIVRHATAVSAVPEKGVLVWRLEEPWSRHRSNEVRCSQLDVSSTAEYVACITAGGDVHVWSTADTMTLGTGRALSGPAQPTQQQDPWERLYQLVRFSPDGRLVLAAMSSGDIYVWKAALGVTAEDRPVFHVEPSKVWGLKRYSQPRVAFSPGSRWIAAVDHDNNLFVLSTDTDALNIANPVGVVGDGSKVPVAFSEDDQWMAWTNHRRRDPGSGKEGVVVQNSLSVWKVGTSERFEVRPPPPVRGGGPMEDLDDFYSKFSPGAKWLIGRQVWSPFVTWDLSKAAKSIGVWSAGHRGTVGMDCSSEIWFSPNGDWVFGFANGCELYFWRTSEPQGLDNKPLFPGSYSGEARPSVTFSSDGSRAAAVAPDGALYVWSPEAGDSLGRPVARLYAGAQAQFSTDGAHVYSADQINVYFGHIEQPLDLVAISTSPVQAITLTPDASRLVIFTKDRILVSKRVWYVWGIPLWELRWPVITNPLNLHDT
jgi:WD40 repeat protein